ncbi:MAG TPA: hypothetical protein DD381_01590 [Lentisphaeria bacterium]|nr:MAG: hypothetical protein A2X47_10440 [Lentisphaerae bacterium GWF2_38_69]HBM15034.1 hypothetical protein [Lentisphaeria bacterium]
MKKIIALFLVLFLTVLLSSCNSDENEPRPYDPLSTAEMSGTSDASNPEAKYLLETSDSGMVGYANFQDALSDTTYTKSPIPLKNK